MASKHARERERWGREQDVARELEREQEERGGGLKIDGNFPSEALALQALL